MYCSAKKRNVCKGNEIVYIRKAARLLISCKRNKNTKLGIRRLKTPMDNSIPKIHTPDLFFDEKGAFSLDSTGVWKRIRIFITNFF